MSLATLGDMLREVPGSQRSQFKCIRSASFFKYCCQNVCLLGEHSPHFDQHICDKDIEINSESQNCATTTSEKLAGVSKSNLTRCFMKHSWDFLAILVDTYLHSENKHGLQRENTAVFHKKMALTALQVLETVQNVTVLTSLAGKANEDETRRNLYQKYNGLNRTGREGTQYSGFCLCDGAGLQIDAIMTGIQR